MEVESGGDFEGWLCSKLKEMGLDEEVFCTYVTGVLDEEDTNDNDRQEALFGILDGMTETPAEKVSAEILTRWKLSRADLLKKRQDEKEQETLEKQNRLAKIMEKQAATVSAAKVTNSVDEELKKKLLNEYSHQSEEESFDSEDEPVNERVPPRLTGNEADLFKNTNAQAVMEKEKEKRDKQKNENEQKKQQIKDAKEKQKQKAEERKEKEKKRTQKGERRR